VADIIKPRRTTTAGTVPTTSNLADGEFGINTTDRKVYQRVGSDIVLIAEAGSNVASNSSTPYTGTSTNGQKTILHDATSASITHNLATAVGNTAIITIKKIDSSANTVTIDANSTETIDGGLTAVLTRQYESITLVSDGSNWVII
jgi:hypothetical protein